MKPGATVGVDHASGPGVDERANRRNLSVAQADIVYE
jgi:hypothetical protein